MGTPNRELVEYSTNTKLLEVQLPTKVLMFLSYSYDIQGEAGSSLGCPNRVLVLL